MTNQSHTEKDVAEIAAGLTKPQKRALTWKGTTIGCVPSNGQLRERLIGKGLAVKTPGYARRMLDWTPLGLAVRNHLISTPDMPKGGEQ